MAWASFFGVSLSTLTKLVTYHELYFEPGQACRTKPSGEIIMNDNKDFRSALSAFVTGVTIVTATTDDGENLGVTANSFNSVSLDPALVLVSLSRRLRSFEAFEKTSSFAINLLCREQEDLCLRFARQGVEK